MADIANHTATLNTGRVLDTNFTFNDTADTVTITATCTKFSDGTLAPTPQLARLNVTLNTSLNATVDLITGKLTAPPALAGQDFSQDDPGAMLNAGPKTRTGVRLKVSADRATATTFSLDFTP